MDSITDKIRTLRETVGIKYTRPDPARLETYIANMYNTGHPQALAYLKEQRGFNDETIKHFQLGFDLERNAIAIPIFREGELINIKYRLLDDPKGGRYLGESNAETWMFNEEGLLHAKQKKGVLIVEGEIDCMSVWQMGIPNVISPASGKDSFGPWLEAVSSVPRIYIAYDNDEGGRKSAAVLAKRLGEDHCYEVRWPQKDANDFLNTSHPQTDLKDLIKASKSFLTSDFKSLGDVVNMLRSGEKYEFESPLIPSVKFKKGWMAVVSGRQNVGKTAFVMNIANSMAQQGTGVLVLPYERGIEAVGERLLNIVSGDASFKMKEYTQNQWTKLLDDVVDLPVYFAMPARDDAPALMAKSKRFLNTTVVIIDHLDYLVRNIKGSKSEAIGDTLKEIKKVAEDEGIILIVVTHLRKLDMPGSFIARSKKPNIEDLKGDSSLYQDPEVVVLLSETLEAGEILVDVQKNKGPMHERKFKLDPLTGIFTEADRTAADELWDQE